MVKKKRLYMLIGMALILASLTTAAFALNEANNTSRTIETSVDRLQRQVRIAIKDSGPGIPQTEQAHIFEPFYRIDASRSRHQGGAGLGLAISDMIIKKHGGSLQLESNADEKGSTFLVFLPTNDDDEHIEYNYRQ